MSAVHATATFHAMDLAFRAPGHLIALGRITATPAVVALLGGAAQAAEILKPYLARHAAGDWGDAVEATVESNQLALGAGNGMVRSAYRLNERADARVWVFTEANRSATTVLLPEEA